MTTPAGTTMEELERLISNYLGAYSSSQRNPTEVASAHAALWFALAALLAERDALQKDAEVEQWRQRHREDCEMRTNNPACTCDFFTKGGELSPAIRAALAAQEKP